MQAGKVNSVMYLSSVKREDSRKKKKILRKKQMRDELPVLTKNEIRRNRLPISEAIIQELVEVGKLSSASFLQQLISYHEKIRQEHGPDTPVWCRPRLINNREVLDELCSILQSAEQAHEEGNVALEFDILMESSIKYGFGSEDWWWLGEQLLYQCVRVSADYKGDGSMREALARYILGKFLLENVRDFYVNTQNELGICRKLSKGMKWSARRLLKRKQDTLFVESSKLLLSALLLEAEETRKYDPIRAAKICKTARKRAIDSCDRAAEAEVLKLLGKCEMDSGDPKASCESFYRSLVLNIKANKIVQVCEMRIFLALAYLKVENYSDALFQLETLLTFAEENNLEVYKGQAYRYLGEIYINKGQPEMASPILGDAVEIFDDLNDAFNRRRAKTLSAVSGGQEHIAKYIKLIINCGRPGTEGFSYLKQLLNWKDSREPFWVGGEEDDYKLDYPEVLYGQVEKPDDLILELAQLHKESSSELDITIEATNQAESEEEEEGAEEASIQPRPPSESSSESSDEEKVSSSVDLEGSYTSLPKSEQDNNEEGDEDDLSDEERCLRELLEDDLDRRRVGDDYTDDEHEKPAEEDEDDASTRRKPKKRLSAPAVLINLGSKGGLTDI